MAVNWEDDELGAAVEAYRKMLASETHKKSYSKREVYRALAKRFNRTEKAFEYRMQNISAVLQEMEMEWVPGLKPAENVGANVKSRILDFISRWDDEKPIRSKKEAAYKSKLPAIRDWLIEIARHRGKVTYGQVMAAFGIDRYSLMHAMGYIGHQAENQDEPIITALIVNRETGRSSAGLSNAFGVSNDRTERERLYRFWTENDNKVSQVETSNVEVKAARFVSVEARPDQAAFRREVYLAYKGKCAISGCDVLKALDAAHKHSRNWRLGHNSAEDGYLLRKDLHALYDNNLLWISNKGKVELHSSVLDHYQHFLGQKIAEAE